MDKKNIPNSAPEALPSFKSHRGFWKKNSPGLIFILILGAAAAGAYYYAFRTVASAEVAYVKRGTALAAVYGTVHVEPVNEVIVRTRNFGLLTEIKVKEGSTVKEGDTLIEMKDENLERQLDTAESALNQAKIRSTRNPPSAAALKNQEIEVEKLKKLVAANNIAPVEYEKAQNELARLKEGIENELNGMSHEVESLTRIRDGIKDQLSHMTLKSPIGGVVLNLYCHLGEYVPPETQICRIGSADNQVVAEINEEDVGYLQPGMKAHIRLYAHQNKDLTGTLMNILPQAENQVYRVRFNLDTPPETILPGMTGEMNIIIGERTNTLTIPTRAVRKGNVVYVVVNGVVDVVHVKTGFRTIEKIEILEGLDEGAAVIVTNQDLYKSGVRVRELLNTAN